MSKATVQTLAADTAAGRNDPRRRLLQAALELIPEVGWAGVSTRRLAERAGLGSGLVHYHFASLQELLTLAAIGAVEEMLRGFTAQLGQAADPEEAVAAAAATLDDFDTAGSLNLLMTETFLASTRHEDVRVRLEAVLAAFRADLTDWLEADGQVQDARATAVVLAAVFDGLMLHRTIDPTITSAAVLPVLLRIIGKD